MREQQAEIDALVLNLSIVADERAAGCFVRRAAGRLQRRRPCRRRRLCRLAKDVRARQCRSGAAPTATATGRSIRTTTRFGRSNFGAHVRQRRHRWRRPCRSRLRSRWYCVALAAWCSRREPIAADAMTSELLKSLANHETHERITTDKRFSARVFSRRRRPSPRWRRRISCRRRCLARRRRATASTSAASASATRAFRTCSGF